MVNIRNLFLLPFLAFIFCVAAVHAENPKPQSAIAMVGAPKYGADFTHFDYVNPAAPKGGTLKLGVTGSFDSLNPFIVRGQPPLGIGTGYMALVYEPLMARSWDEPFSLYGLIAESIEVQATDIRRIRQRLPAPC